MRKKLVLNIPQHREVKLQQTATSDITAHESIIPCVIYDTLVT